MIESFLEFLKILYQHGIHVFVLIFIIFYLIFFPDKAEKLGSLFYRLFASVHQAAARRYIALDIQSRIDTASKGINAELKGALPYGVKIKWIAAEKVETEVKEGKIIILMKDYRNQSINLARTSLAYVREGLLPRSKQYVDKTLMKAIDHTVARKLVSGNTGSVQYLNEVLEAERKTDQNFDPWLLKATKIDDRGFLTRIIFHDFLSLEKLYPHPPEDGIFKETADYFNLVHKLVTKKPEEDVSPTFNGTCIQVAIVPIARLTMLGIDPHLNYINRTLDEGIERFHIVAAGKNNIMLAKLAAERASKEFPLKIGRKETYKGNYRGERMNLICITLAKV